MTISRAVLANLGCCTLEVCGIYCPLTLKCCTVLRLGGSTSRFIRCPSHAADLQAFDPAGHAYSGEARKQQNETLWKTRTWYVAEQRFREKNDGDSPQPERLHRLVLIHGSSPAVAYDAANSNAVSFLCEQLPLKGQSGPQFSGLFELTLIYDDLEDDAELSSTKYALSLHEFSAYMSTIGGA